MKKKKKVGSSIGGTPLVEPGTVATMLCACHLASMVTSPFKEAGGVMLVGAPGTLKSTLALTLSKYPDALALSDVNVQGLSTLRDQIASSTIRTLILPELAKLYERHPTVAANVEGTIRALAGEGFHSMSFEDHRVNRLKARCTVIGALTSELQGKKWAAWEASGFARRFLWAVTGMDTTVLDQSVIVREPIRLQLRPPVEVPIATRIPSLTTQRERHHIVQLLQYQPKPHSTQASLLERALSVLKWWDRSTAMDILREFAKLLGQEGALLDVPQPLAPVVQRRYLHLPKTKGARREKV